VIPSDHFVRYYNEVFKTLAAMGHEHMEAYWRELGRLQAQELAEAFRAGGIQATYDYWQKILEEENCLGELTLTEDYFEFKMNRCPSLGKVLDNDAAPCHQYCDHCMGWIEPTMDAAGLHVAHDIHSRTEPHCVLRVYADEAKMRDWEATALLPCRPYDDPPAKA